MTERAAHARDPARRGRTGTRREGSGTGGRTRNGPPGALGRAPGEPVKRLGMPSFRDYDEAWREADAILKADRALGFGHLVTVDPVQVASGPGTRTRTEWAIYLLDPEEDG